MAINNEEQLKTAVSKMGTLGGANLPGSITEEITATPDTLLDTEGTLLDPVNQLTTAQADPTGLSNIAATATQDLGQLAQTTEITPRIGEAKAATIDTDMGFEEIQGTVSPESIGVAATAELDGESHDVISARQAHVKHRGWRASASVGSTGCS